MLTWMAGKSILNTRIYSCKGQTMIDIFNLAYQGLRLSSVVRDELSHITEVMIYGTTAVCISPLYLTVLWRLKKIPAHHESDHGPTLYSLKIQLRPRAKVS